MVVFMDQLSAQTPPMKDNVPVIGQVSSASRFSWWNCYRGSNFCFFLVFCGIAYYYLLLNDQYYLLSPSSSHGRSTCFAIMVTTFSEEFEITTK